MGEGARISGIRTLCGKSGEFSFVYEGGSLHQQSISLAFAVCPNSARFCESCLVVLSILLFITQLPSYPLTKFF